MRAHFLDFVVGRGNGHYVLPKSALLPPTISRRCRGTRSVNDHPRRIG